MNRKSLIIVIILGLVLIGAGIYLNQKGTPGISEKATPLVTSDPIPTSGARLLTFTVERPELGTPNFIATGSKLGKIEIIGMTDATSSKSVNLGQMEMVEANKDGDQTWMVEVPKANQKFKQVYAQSYGEKNDKLNKIVLPYVTSEEVTTALWPSEVQAVISGTIKSVGNGNLTLLILHTKNYNVKVTYAKDMSVADATGKPISLSSLKVGRQIDVTGKYLDEISFSATKIEIVK